MGLFILKGLMRAGNNVTYLGREGYSVKKVGWSKGRQITQLTWTERVFSALNVSGSLEDMMGLVGWMG